MGADELKYTKEHEWVLAESDTAIVGITAFAAEQLGDITYVELPEIGRKVSAGDEVATVESVKAASDIFAPVSGTVIAINEGLEDRPELVNESPEGDGWFFKLKDTDAAEFAKLMDSATYSAFVKEQDH